MWTLDWELEIWFAKVKEKRKKQFSVSDDDDDDDFYNSNPEDYEYNELFEERRRQLRGLSE